MELERRQRRKKRMKNDTSKDPGLSAKEETERNLKGTIDHLFNEIKSRNVCLQEVDKNF